MNEIIFRILEDQSCTHSVDYTTDILYSSASNIAHRLQSDQKILWSIIKNANVNYNFSELR